MQNEMSLVAAGNTWNPCLIVLRQMGHDLWREMEGDKVFWCARKGAAQFTAYSPPELLGLAAMFQHLGERWNQQKPYLLGELPIKEGDDS